MADKGCDSKANCQAAGRPGAVRVIACRKTAKAKPTFIPKALEKGRARIEQAVESATASSASPRCESTRENLASIVAIASGFIVIIRPRCRGAAQHEHGQQTGTGEVT